MVSLLPALARVSLLVTFVLAVVSRQLFFVDRDAGRAWAGGLGWGLAVLAVVFIFGHRIWPVTATLVPAVVGLFAVSGLDPAVSLFTYFAVLGALGLWAFAFMSGGPRRVGWPLAGFLAVSALMAAATLRFLPWAQPHVERAVADTFAVGTTGLQEQSRLGEFGELAVSNRVVLRAWTDEPRLLRAYVHSWFDGREWSSPVRADTPPPPPVRPTTRPDLQGWLTAVPGNLFVVPRGEGASLRGQGVVETRVLQSEIRDWPLLIPASTHLVRAPTPRLDRSREGVLRWPVFEPALHYGAVHAASPGAPSRGGDETFTARAVALGLPGRLDPRLRVLARVLADGSSTDRGRVQGTVEWLRSGYTYSLEVGEFETDDPLAEFLFEKKKGYCEYFATAAAVLLRLQGVPARYVMGFSVGPQNFVPGRFGVGDHYLVRESDAHAWIEAYIPGEGWVEADPTPPADFSLLHTPAAGWLAPLVEAVRVHLARLWAGLRHEGLAGLWRAVTAGVEALLAGLWRHPGVTGTVVAAVLLGWTWPWWRALGERLRRRRRARQDRHAALPGELDPLLAAVERHWEGQGRPRPPSRGLREHLDELPADLLSPAAREASDAVVDACYRSAFGGRPPSPETVAALRAAVDRMS
jgi:transglutaminase-like putative cysteine protease